MATQPNRCNKCGKPISKEEQDSSIWLRKQMGYHSQHDGDRVDLDLCPTCSDNELEALQERCEVPVFINDGGYNDGRYGD